MSKENIDDFKAALVAADYCSNPERRGGFVNPKAKYYKRDGSEHTFDDVQLPSVVEKLELVIRRMPKSRGWWIYHSVMADIPGYKEVAKSEWKQEPMNPHGQAMSSFSVCCRDWYGAILFQADVLTRGRLETPPYQV